MFVDPLFRDRSHAGQVLAEMLRPVVGVEDALALGLPRGGVPVAYEVASALHADLDIVLVRKIGAPGQEELALGAVASGGTRVLNQSLIDRLSIAPVVIERITARANLEIERRERLYRGDRPPLPIRNRTVILVDDGLATGASMLAAVRAVQAQQPRRVIVAAPVASREACQELQEHVDQVVCARTPEPFQAVGAWYEDFSQTSDTDVQQFLQRTVHTS